MNKLGKMLLVATSLSPIFLVCAVITGLKEQWHLVAIYGSLFAVLLGLLIFLLKVAIPTLAPEPMETAKVKSADKDMIAFVLAYLLPLIYKDEIKFEGDWKAAALVVGIIGLIVYHSNAFTFNPVLAAIGYRFYEVESGSMTYLLISKTHIISPTNTLTVRHVCDYIYLE